jgi:hypothetical protein
MANLTLIETKTVSAGGISSISFTSIPAGYTDLKLVVSARTSQAATNDSGYLYFNSINTNYSNIFTYGTGSGSGSASNTTGIYISPINGDSSSSGLFSATEIYISNYRSTTFAKTVTVNGVQESNAAASFMAISSGLWNPGTQQAIDTITLYPSTGPNWLEFSTFSLYGVSNTIASGAKAYGGIVTEDSTYWYHTFTSSSIFTPTQSLSCDYLVIAGGAGGGGFGGGGGGAGGLRTSLGGSPLSLTATNYTVTVGAGGAGNLNTGNFQGANGGNSAFSTISTTGGGTGSGNPGGSPQNGNSGGSGGGGCYNGSGGAGNAGSYSPVEGYAGGAGTTSTNTQGGGGGGAGGAGASGGSGGNGGVGISNSITGTAIYYAGGGGGGNCGNNGVSTGGTGGGGNGGNNGVTRGLNGQLFTGSGGGGGSSNVAQTYQQPGGNGGSGIVIVRYAK